MATKATREAKYFDILTAANSVWVWEPIFVQDYEDIIFQFATDGGLDADLNVKFQGSLQNRVPDFSAPASVDNMWAYIEVVDWSNNNPESWLVWITCAGEDKYLQLWANVQGLQWINAEVTARVEWEVTVRARLYGQV